MAKQRKTNQVRTPFVAPVEHRGNTHKVCKTCQVNKPVTEFYWVQGRTNRPGAKYPRSDCKVCYRNRHLARLYQLAPGEYEEKLKDQGGVCEICQESQRQSPSDNHSLNVDHNHKTGEVRGLLCNPCNKLLGGAEDNIETLKQAIKYLRKYS